LSTTVVGSNDIKHMLRIVERDLSSTMVYGVHVHHCIVTTIGRNAWLAVAAMRQQVKDVLQRMQHMQRMQHTQRMQHMQGNTAGTAETAGTTTNAATTATTATTADSLDSLEAPLCSCRVSPCKERGEIEDNRKWHKGGLSRFFSGGSANMSQTYFLTMHVVGHRFSCLGGEHSGEHR
jgi:hypothetical protein